MNGNQCLWLMWCILCLVQTGCGVMVGTVVDTAIDVASYPFKEYVFWGAYKYDNTWSEPYQLCENERDHGQLVVGLAVSGGGSRSAYFFACVMAELNRIEVAPGRSLADEVDYISSVSGGSLASAYYCLNRYAAKQDPKFFARFQADMAYNFEQRAMIRYVLAGRGVLDMLTYYDRGDLMAEVWDDKRFLGPTTFADLAAAEKRGAPALIINGTTINDGLPFVFSNLSPRHFQPSAYFAALQQAGFIRHSAEANYQPFHITDFSTIRSDIRPYRLSKAVVASASVPHLLGPVSLKDYSREDRLIHIVDGGVYDNYGVENLMQVITNYLDNHPGQRARIIVIDGSGYFPEQNQQSDKFSVAYYSERLLSIAWMRTKAYMEYVFQQARQFQNGKGERPYRNLEFELVSLYDVLPSQQQEKPIVKERALQSILRPDVTTMQFLNKLTSIQTRFSLAKQDAQMIEAVARRVVGKMAGAKPQEQP